MSISLPTSANHQTTRYDITAFVSDVEAVIAAETDPDCIAEAVARHLHHLLQTPDLLTPEQRCSNPDKYCANLVAVAPSGKFSVVALVWLPGQITAIHDHICWCVVGVLEGVEHEQRFHLLADTAGSRWLVPSDTEMMTPGMTAALVPPSENIHRVSNAGDTLAISLHVYGADLNAIASHSSINECFDALPVRADLAGTPVPWRANHPDQPCE